MPRWGSFPRCAGIVVTGRLSGNCRELVKIIKTLYNRKAARAQRGKRGTAVDERYFRMAEEQLYGELAYVLGMEKSAMPEYIARCIHEEA